MAHTNTMRKQNNNVQQYQRYNIQQMEDTLKLQQ